MCGSLIYSLATGKCVKFPWYVNILDFIFVILIVIFTVSMLMMCYRALQMAKQRKVDHDEIRKATGKYVRVAIMSIIIAGIIRELVLLLPGIIGS